MKFIFAFKIYKAVSYITHVAQFDNLNHQVIKLQTNLSFLGTEIQRKFLLGIFFNDLLDY